MMRVQNPSRKTFKNKIFRYWFVLTPSTNVHCMKLFDWTTWIVPQQNLILKDSLDTKQNIKQKTICKDDLSDSIVFNYLLDFKNYLLKFKVKLL